MQNRRCRWPSCSPTAGLFTLFQLAGYDRPCSTIASSDPFVLASGEFCSCGVCNVVDYRVAVVSSVDAAPDSGSFPSVAAAFGAMQSSSPISTEEQPAQYASVHHVVLSPGRHSSGGVDAAVGAGFVFVTSGTEGGAVLVLEDATWELGHGTKVMYINIANARFCFPWPVVEADHESANHSFIVSKEYLVLLSPEQPPSPVGSCGFQRHCSADRKAANAVDHGRPRRPRSLPCGAPPPFRAW